MIADLLPIGFDLQCLKKQFGVKIVDFSAVSAAPIVPEAAVTQGDIPPFFTDAQIAYVNETMEMPIFYKYIGQAVISVAEDRLRGDGMADQPFQQVIWVTEAVFAESLRLHIVHVHPSVVNVIPGLIQKLRKRSGSGTTGGVSLPQQAHSVGQRPGQHLRLLQKALVAGHHALHFLHQQIADAVLDFVAEDLRYGDLPLAPPHSGDALQNPWVQCLALQNTVIIHGHGRTGQSDVVGLPGFLCDV